MSESDAVDRASRLAERCLVVSIVAIVLGAGLPAAALETDPGWLGSIETQIADSEYEITWDNQTVLPGLEASWQAPNRAHGFRTYFTDGGIRVVPRLEEAPSWEWSLSLAGWGRVRTRRIDAHGSSAHATARFSRSEPLESAQKRVEGLRVTYDRGSILEWYVNDRRGLEQGFTIAAPPLGLEDGVEESGDGAKEQNGERQRVWINLALGGTLDAVVSEDGQAIDFVTADGARVLHYAALTVHDARGRQLPAWMEGFAGGETARGIRIVFDDGEAIYPVTVDPLTMGPVWTAETNQAGAEFGISVATAGNVNGDGYSDVIVGADSYDNDQANEGRAFLYLGSASGLATTAAWTAEGNQASTGLGFGRCVATAGDVNGDGYSDVVVGQPYYDNDQANEGRAYVYMGSALGLATSAAWIREGNLTDASFGWAVAPAGDVNGDGFSDIIVGAIGYANGQSGEGGAFVYLGSAGGLATTAAWTKESNQGDAQYGFSASTAGNVNGDGFADVVVGARYLDCVHFNEGRAYLYLGSAAGPGTNAAWIADGILQDAELGNSVATAGDVNGDGYADVIVGAPLYDNGQVQEGRAYVYLGSAGGLANNPAWTTEGNQVTALFGWAVSTAGDINGDGYADVIVGAYGFSNDQSNEGKAFVYLGSATGLSSVPTWTAEGNSLDSRFGYAVATAGDVNGDGFSDVIVGAFGADNGETNEGQALVYLGSPSGLTGTGGWLVSGPVSGMQLGTSVASAGDVNGDGYADVIVGAPLRDAGETDEGIAYLYLGSSGGLSTLIAWSNEGNNFEAHYGASVGTAGDVNGDGYSDVIVGAYGFSNGQTNEGRAFVYLGSASGLSTTPAWTGESNQTDANFGWSVGTAGDVNGDGYSDVLAGARVHASGQVLEGLVFIYHGSPTGLATPWSKFLEGNSAGAQFGYSVGTAGDVDADGFSDVIIGAPFHTNGHVSEGRAYLYKGSPSGLGSLPIWTIEGNQNNANFGRSVGTAGDVNGDGFSDVIVGMPMYDNVESDEGRALVYLGSLSGLATTPAWMIESNNAGGHLGSAVATAGDVTGDGFADVIVGADGYTNSLSGEGRAFVYRGSATGLSTAAAWVVGGNQTGARFGASVGSAGDVNGDGYADIIVGAPSFDAGASDEGRAFGYLGAGGTNFGWRPMQRRVAAAIPVGRLGISDDNDSLRFQMLARSPFGRGRVRMEWEVKTARSLLNGTSAAAGSWVDSGTAGATLSQTVVDAATAGGVPLHWRVRAQYKPSSTPFQQRGRWVTIPWGGWNETMLRTAFIPAGSVPDGANGSPLRMTKVAGGQIRFDWEASCRASDTDYEIYEGAAGGTFTTHVPRLCTTSGTLTATLTPSAGPRYYLVVPRNMATEGSYGTTSTGAEIPVSTQACLHHQYLACQSVCVGGKFPGATCSSNADCPGGCSGFRFGMSCLLNSECTGHCSNDGNIACSQMGGMDPACRYCLADHTIQCTSAAQCVSVGGSCSGPGSCNGVGSCQGPSPGTCVVQ